jgi:hypothetical protein
MANPPDGKANEPAPSAEGKLPWTQPAVETFPARDADVIANPYGGPDAGIYHS